MSEHQTFGDLQDHLRKMAESIPDCGVYKPSASYSDTGDILNVMWSDEPYYARCLNSTVRLLISEKTDTVIGCQVWGLKGRVLVEGDQVKQKKKRRPSLGTFVQEQMRRNRLGIKMCWNCGRELYLSKYMMFLNASNTETVTCRCKAVNTLSGVYTEEKEGEDEEKIGG